MCPTDHWHLTRERGGNVRDRHVVEVTSGSFEKEAVGVNPPSAGFHDRAGCVPKKTDFDADSGFSSAHRNPADDIPPTRNNCA
jgi:hypothetical protein